MANNYVLTVGLGSGSIGFLRGSFGSIATVPGRPLLDVPVDEFRVRSLFDPINPLGMTLRLQGGVKSRNRDLISVQFLLFTVEFIWNEPLGSYETGEELSATNALNGQVGLSIDLTIFVEPFDTDRTETRALRNTWFQKRNHIEPFKQQVSKTLIDENLGVYVGPSPVPTPPSQFSPSDWSVATGSGPNEVDLTITQLPNDNGAPITEVQVEVDSTGLWAPLSILTGTQTLPMPAPSVPYDFSIRAINAMGPGTGSAIKSATSGAAGGGGTTGILAGAEETDYNGAYVQSTTKGTVDGSGVLFSDADTTYVVWTREILGVYYVWVWNGFIWFVGTTAIDPETWTNGGATGIEQVSPTPEPFSMMSEDIDGSNSPDSSNLLPGFTITYVP